MYFFIYIKKKIEQRKVLNEVQYLFEVRFWRGDRLCDELEQIELDMFN